MTGSRRERAEAAAREFGPQAVGIGLDVRTEPSVGAFVDETYERLGGVDVLVNNAGIGMLTVNPRFPRTRSRSGRSRRAASATWSRRR